LRAATAAAQAHDEAGETSVASAAWANNSRAR